MPDRPDPLHTQGLHRVPEDRLHPGPYLRPGPVLGPRSGLQGTVPPGTVMNPAPGIRLPQPVLGRCRPVRRIRPDRGARMVRVQHQVHDPCIMDGRLRPRRLANPLVLSVNADGVLVAEVRPTGFLRPLRIPVLLPAPRLLIIIRLPPKRRHLPHAGLHDLAAPGLVADLAKMTFESLQPLVQQPDLPAPCFPEPPDRRRVRHTVLKVQTQKSHQGPPVLHRVLQLLVRPAIPARQRPYLEPQPPRRRVVCHPGGPASGGPCSPGDESPPSPSLHGGVPGDRPCGRVVPGDRKDQTGRSGTWGLEGIIGESQFYQGVSSSRGYSRCPVVSWSVQAAHMHEKRRPYTTFILIGSWFVLLCSIR